MFGNAYQNGQIFEVWDSKVNPEKNQQYRQLFKMIPASIKKYFDKDVKSYIYSLEGQVSKMCLPASDQKQLSLHQKYIVLHIYIPHGSSWSMELGITDITNTKRRINFTSTQGKQQVKYFSLRYPLSHLERGVWLFLGVNIYSFMEAFKDQVFRSLDHITVGSNCSIRRIFTMKQWSQWEIPKGYWFPGQIPQQFQLIQYCPPSCLPKISMSKGSVLPHNYSEQPVTSLYEKLTPNKIDSKIALAKSQIGHTPMTKSKVYNMKPMSLQPIGNSAHSPESKQIQSSKIKLRLNSMKDEGQKSLLKRQKQSRLHDHNVFKKQRDIRISHREQQHQEPVKSKIRKSIHKSPILQKSFREDQALAVQQSSNNFQTSHETIIQNKNFATLTKSKNIDEKWTSSDEGKKKPNMEKPSKVDKKSKQGRTQLVKENHEVKKKVIQGKKQQIELIYDEMVGFYYHPQTHMYYELKN